MSKNQITYDDWIGELTRIASLTNKGDGLTTREIANAVGRSQKWVVQKLSILKQAGRLVVGRGTRESIDGFNKCVSVYKIKSK